MEPVISPVPVELLKTELTRDKFVRMTNNLNNEIYIFNHFNAPYLTKEIGRLREESFRFAGGGTGLPFDLDDFDTGPNPYDQLIVWDPENEIILGGYRFFNCKTGDCIQNSQEVHLSTAHLFEFSERFKRDFMPHMIELGRSFVHPDYISGKVGRKGIYALDNLWDGLGALIIDNPSVNYFFGKVTMYPHFPKYGRDLILYFMNTHFPDTEDLVKPIVPLKYHHSLEELSQAIQGVDYKEDLKRMTSSLRLLGTNVPPLINAYMGLSSSMRCFGTALNDEFGDVEETGILITIPDIFEEKTKRHIESYLQQFD